MKSYCLKCKKHTKKFLVLVMVGKFMMRSKKFKFINKQEANGLLSKLGIKTSLSKILILGDVLF